MIGSMGALHRSTAIRLAAVVTGLAATACVDLAREGRSKALALAMMAKVRYHRGELDEAVAAQKQAYFLINPRHKAEFRRLLRNYQDAAIDNEEGAQRGGG